MVYLTSFCSLSSTAVAPIIVRFFYIWDWRELTFYKRSAPMMVIAYSYFFYHFLYYSRFSFRYARTRVLRP
jgi:hypothetical protein